MNEPNDPNAPLRGPTFAVVAPTVGVVIVLIVLALRSCGCAAPASAQGLQTPRKTLSLDEPDRRRLEEQRSWIEELARRHIGTPTHTGSMGDLRVLQDLLDRGVVRRDQVYELQAMGVVLGDVMVANLGLRWMVVEDEQGRSRALVGTGRESIVFPITMISKRVAAGIPVDVRKLYESIASSYDSSR